MVPKQYRYNAAEWMLKSKTGMIWITELDYAQLVAGLYYETLSGTNTTIGAKSNCNEGRN